MCSHSFPSSQGNGFALEPLRPRGLVSTEGIRVGPPSWLGQLQGGRGRGEGWAGGSGSRGAGCGEGSTSGFCSLIWTSVKCGARWHVAWRGRGRGGARLLPGHRPAPTFRHFREKLTTAWVSRRASSFPTVRTPLACPRGRQRTQGTLADGRACATVCVTLLQLSWLSPLASQKRAGNKHPNSPFIKMELCCKGKRDSNPTGSGGKAARRG